MAKRLCRKRRTTSLVRERCGRAKSFVMLVSAMQMLSRQHTVHARNS
jgi:hypothetical protein